MEENFSARKLGSDMASVKQSREKRKIFPFFSQMRSQDYPEIRSKSPDRPFQAWMCKAFHDRSGLHPKMLPQGQKFLAQQMMAANGDILLGISGYAQ